MVAAPYIPTRAQLRLLKVLHVMHPEPTTWDGLLGGYSILLGKRVRNTAGISKAMRELRRQELVVEVPQRAAGEGAGWCKYQLTELGASKVRP